MSSVIILTGCGYSLRGAGTSLPPDVKNIYIANIDNRTSDASIARLVDEAIRDKFARYRAVNVVEEVGRADAVMNIELIAIKRGRGATSSQTDTAVQEELSLLMTAEVVRSNGVRLWKSETITVSQNYGTTSETVLASTPGFAGSSIDATALSKISSREVARGQERYAMRYLAEEVANRVYEEGIAEEF
jgi:outer membrane lipopolysaccharide assembly protein LptE/RlpB